MKKSVAVSAIAIGAGILLYLYLSRPGDASMILCNGVIYTLDEDRNANLSWSCRADGLSVTFEHYAHAIPWLPTINTGAKGTNLAALLHIFDGVR